MSLAAVAENSRGSRGRMPEEELASARRINNYIVEKNCTAIVMPGMPDNRLPATTPTYTQKELIASDTCIIASELESDGGTVTSHHYRQQRQWQRRRSSREERKRKLGENEIINGDGNSDKSSSLASPPPPSRLLLVPPPPLVSPAFTPPTTPGGTFHATNRSGASARSEWRWNGNVLERARTSDFNDDAKKADGHINDPSTKTSFHNTHFDVLHPQNSYPVSSLSPSSTLHLDLVDRLPTVTCAVRARIPTTIGTEMFLHLYHNDVDNKEHLAIVFGNKIRSRSLDAFRPGETEMDRMVRGAYTGRLFPGRASSSAETRQDKSSSEKEVDGGIDKDQDEEEEEEDPPPLVRIHSECYTGETVWSARCDCGEQLDEAARLMALPSDINDRAKPSHVNSSNSGTDTSHITASISYDKKNTTGPGGAIIYLRQEGRGIGLGEKLKAYNLQDLGSDTYDANLLLRHPADARSYGLATAMLVDLGLGGKTGIRLLTNNPDKVRAVEGPGREVVVRERVGMVPLAWRTGNGGGSAGGAGGGSKANKYGGVRGEEVERYLTTKVLHTYISLPLHARVC